MTSVPKATVRGGTSTYSNDSENSKRTLLPFVQKRATIEDEKNMDGLPPVVEVTAATFHQIVIDSEKDVLIEFYTKVRITN